MCTVNAVVIWFVLFVWVHSPGELQIIEQAGTGLMVLSQAPAQYCAWFALGTTQKLCVSFASISSPCFPQFPQTLLGPQEAVQVMESETLRNNLSSSPALPRTSCMAVGKSLSLPEPRFLICKMRGLDQVTMQNVSTLKAESRRNYIFLELYQIVFSPPWLLRGGEGSSGKYWFLS